MRLVIACVVLFVLVSPILLLSVAEEKDPPAAKSSESKMAAVESDPHEFMEYAIQPFFNQLKRSLSNQPSSKKAWVPVKANALVLAESGNLLMLRTPQENSDDWNKIAAELRDTGKEVYAAAKKRDYLLTREHYITFVKKCNACHDKFADGEHQQKP